MKCPRVISALLTCALLIGFAMPNQSHADCQRHDPIVGVWLQNQKEVNDPDLILAAQAIFNADGTCVRNLDPNLQRVLGPPLFPEGTVFSISDDYSFWQRKSKHCYECTGTQILLIKGEDGNFTPLARSKCVIDIHLCGNNLSATETLSFFDYYDLTLTKPFEGLPTLHFTIEGKRLK